MWLSRIFAPPIAGSTGTLLYVFKLSGPTSPEVSVHRDMISLTTLVDHRGGNIVLILHIPTEVIRLSQLITTVPIAFARLQSGGQRNAWRITPAETTFHGDLMGCSSD